jgi:hypothetical protein
LQKLVNEFLLHFLIVFEVEGVNQWVFDEQSDHLLTGNLLQTINLVYCDFGNGFGGLNGVQL